MGRGLVPRITALPEDLSKGLIHDRNRALECGTVVSVQLCRTDTNSVQGVLLL